MFSSSGSAMGSPGGSGRRGSSEISWAGASGAQGRQGGGGVVKGEMSNGGSPVEEDPLRKRPRESASWRCVCDLLQPACRSESLWPDLNV